MNFGSIVCSNSNIRTIVFDFKENNNYFKNTMGHKGLNGLACFNMHKIIYLIEDENLQEFFLKP